MVDEVVIEFKDEGLEGILNDFDRLEGKINNVSKAGRILARQQKMTNRLFEGGAQRLIDNATRTNQLAERYNSFGKVMAMPLDIFTEFNKQGGQFIGLGARAAGAIRRWTHGMRGFRMEMLGVLLFGMAIQRFFTSMLRPALELTGVFGTWTSILQILFLPVGLLLLDIMLKVLDFVAGLSDETKLLIGKFVLLGIGLGVLFFYSGRLC